MLGEISGELAVWSLHSCFSNKLSHDLPVCPRRCVTLKTRALCSQTWSELSTFVVFVDLCVCTYRGL